MTLITVITDINNDGNPRSQGDAVKEKGSQNVYTLDEAIAATKSGKFQTILIILTGLSVFGSSIENTNVSYIMPYAKCDLQLTAEEQGFLSGISYFGIVFTSHLFGFLADTWGRQKVLRISAIGAFIFSFSSALAVNTISLIVLRFLAGAFVAGSATTALSYISEFHTIATAARAGALVSIGLCIGWVAMSPLAILIIPMDWAFPIYTFLEYKPWRLFITCTSLINLINGITFSFLPETPKFLLAMNRNDEALKVLKRMYAMNTGEPEEKYPVKKIESVVIGNNLADAKGICGFLSLVVKQTKPIFRPPLLQHTWKLCFVMFVLYSLGHGTFIWFPDFLFRLHTYDGVPKTLCEIVGSKTVSNITNTTEIACTVDNKNLLPFQLLFVIGLVCMMIAIITSFLLAKIKPKSLIGVWFMCGLTASILLKFFTEFYSIVTSFMIFSSIGISANIVMAVAVSLFPTNYRAMATAFILMCGRIGSVTGSSMIGILLNINCDLIFYLGGGMVICCSLVFMMIKIKPQ